MPRAVVLSEALPKSAAQESLDTILKKCCVHLDKPKPTPQAHEVLVEMVCRPVNPSDVMCLRGLYKDFCPDCFPATPGLEGCGVVAAVGEEVSGLKAGDRVMPLLSEYGARGNGSWQDFVAVKASDVIQVPEGISDDMAAMAFINPWTVVGLMETLAVPEGESVLISAASSALGKEMVAYNKKIGVKSICLVRRNSAVEELKQLGAYHVFNTETQDVCKEVMEATWHKGAYGAVEPVGGEVTKAVAACTRNGGKVLIFGALAGGDVCVSAMDLIFRDVTVQGFYLPHWLKEKYPSMESRKGIAEKVFSLFKEGVFKPCVGKKFGLEEFEAAVKESMREGKGGKAMLVTEASGRKGGGA